jgi:two-component system, OmpR family, sensor kinase
VRAGLHTVSLRRRVIIAGVLVIAAVLLLLGVATNTLFATQSRRDTDALLRARGQLAEQLTLAGVGPRELLRRVEATGLDARLTTPSGQQFGNASPPAGMPLQRRHTGGLQRFGSTTVLERGLPDGSQLLLVADGDELTAAQHRLRRLLFGVGLGALAVATVALIAVVRVALAPLDAMTAVAQSIARGDRGRRLSPTRTDTELGRTASAFDQMLDALEGAERQARHAEAAARTSEGRTRRFVADAAHELRTPIAGVQAAAEAVLQAGPGGSQEDRDRLHLLLVREARRAGRLVEDLLALARIDAGLELHPIAVDLTTLVSAEAERTRLLAPQLTVTIDMAAVSDAPAVIVADPERIAQVLANLLDNARRHTPDGGQITIRVSRAGPEVEVSVADTGPGVPPQDRERIFDRLVRLDAARTADSGGAGLGLAIARGIARAHGGDLRCAEPPGGTGALFLLTLPSPTAPAADDPTATFRDSPNGHGLSPGYLDCSTREVD